jgi:hypothetical protein
MLWADAAWDVCSKAPVTRAWCAAVPCTLRRENRTRYFSGRSVFGSLSLFSKAWTTWSGASTRVAIATLEGGEQDAQPPVFKHCWVPLSAVVKVVCIYYSEPPVTYWFAAGFNVWFVSAWSPMSPREGFGSLFRESRQLLFRLSLHFADRMLNRSEATGMSVKAYATSRWCVCALGKAATLHQAFMQWA